MGPPSPTHLHVVARALRLHIDLGHGVWGRHSVQERPGDEATAHARGPEGHGLHVVQGEPNAVGVDAEGATG